MKDNNTFNVNCGDKDFVFQKLLKVPIIINVLLHSFSAARDQNLCE